MNSYVLLLFTLLTFSHAQASLTQKEALSFLGLGCDSILLKSKRVNSPDDKSKTEDPDGVNEGSLPPKSRRTPPDSSHYYDNEPTSRDRPGYDNYDYNFSRDELDWNDSSPPVYRRIPDNNRDQPVQIPLHIYDVDYPPAAPNPGQPIRRIVDDRDVNGAENIY
jgi:hypothetical protein